MACGDLRDYLQEEEAHPSSGSRPFPALPDKAKGDNLVNMQQIDELERICIVEQSYFYNTTVPC